MNLFGPRSGRHRCRHSTGTDPHTHTHAHTGTGMYVEAHAQAQAHAHMHRHTHRYRSGTAQVQVLHSRGTGAPHICSTLHASRSTYVFRVPRIRFDGGSQMSNDRMNSDGLQFVSKRDGVNFSASLMQSRIYQSVSIRLPPATAGTWCGSLVFTQHLRLHR